jgi:mandelate racemase
VFVNAEQVSADCLFKDHRFAVIAALQGRGLPARAYGADMTEQRIRRLSVRPLELPLTEPVRTAVGVMTSTPLALIDIVAEDGTAGRSYLRTYTPVALASLARLLEDLAPSLVGRAGPAAQLTAELREMFRLLGDRGLVGMALAGIDMALWDMDAKRAGLSLARLLGAQTTSIPAYRPLIATAAGPACDEAERALAAGSRALKVKVGHGELADDVEVISRLAGLLDRTGELMVDYNQALSLGDAIARLGALSEYRLSWIEEPLNARDLLGYAHLTSSTSTPVAAGESLESADEIELLLELNGADVLTLDAARVGGVTGWQRAARSAAVAGRPVCNHAFPELSVHLLAASRTGRWLEHHDYVSPILTRPVTVTAGRAQVPSEPGVGLEWDEAALATLR